MRQFIFASDGAFEDLERRARGLCVRFHDQEMPAVTAPSRAAIGFEIDPGSREAWLLVEHGLVYHGPSPEIHEWFTSGKKRFDDFSELKAWIRGHLRGLYVAGGLYPLGAQVGQVNVSGVPDSTDELGMTLNRILKELETMRWAILGRDRSGDLPS